MSGDAKEAPMSAELLETIEYGVALLTLNRPDRLNAFSDDMLRALIEAFTRLGADTDVRAIVLTGAGRGFCAGGDIKGMANRKPRTFDQRVEDLRWKTRLPLAMRDCPKIVIGMINGAAVGAGLGPGTEGMRREAVIGSEALSRCRCDEREVSAPQELLGRCDCSPPRGHRDTAKRAVRLGGDEMALDVEGVVGRAPVHHAGGEPIGDAKALVDLAQR